MPAVTIPKKQYQELVEKSLRFEFVQHIMTEDLFSPPPTKNITEIMGHFAATKRYSKKFLESLKKGISKSSFIKI